MPASQAGRRRFESGHPLFRNVCAERELACLPVSGSAAQKSNQNGNYRFGNDERVRTMPRLKQRVASYRLHKGSGQAVVTLGGRDVYLGRHGSEESVSEYRRLIAEWLACHRQAPPPRLEAAASSSSDITINELILAYWEFAKGYYVKNSKPTGELPNIQDAVKPLARLYGSTRVSDFGPIALETVRQAMVGANLCRTVINSRVNRIRRVIKWGVRRQMVAPAVLISLQSLEPLKRGRCQVRESNPVKPVADADVEAILPLVSRQAAAMIQLQRLTGMRPCEVTIMRGCDLDISGRIWVYRPSSHKTEHHGRERLIYLGPRAQEIVKPFLKPDLVAFLFSPRDAMAERYVARRTHRGRPNTIRKTTRRLRDRYTTTSYARAIAYGCDQAFPPPPELLTPEPAVDQPQRLREWRRQHRWSPNRLRHSAATLLRKQYGLDAARVILGHSSPAVTEIYAELDHSKALQIMAEVG
jgi:integrase